MQTARAQGAVFPATIRALLALGTIACGGSGTAAVGASTTDAGADASSTPGGGSDSSSPSALDGTAGDGSKSPPPPDGATSSGPPDGSITPTDAAALSGLRIDLTQTSVSGFSSGGFMAVQFGVAFSSIIKGIGAFAGGPFGCSQGSVATANTSCANAGSAPDATPLIAATKSLHASGAIDDPANLASARVFLFGGADDAVVSPPVVDATQTYFEGFMPAASIQYVSRRAGTAHLLPTSSYGAPCDSSDAPWLGACGYDGAGTALAQIYGPLAAASSKATGTFVTIPQGNFIAAPASHSLDANAYAYVPTSCANGEICRVHVVFHGCEMGQSVLGSVFYVHAGYNGWADTNHIVVLYPQAIASNSEGNPYGCWDFWGYDSPAYDTKSAPQMAVTRAMIGSLAGAPGDSGTSDQ
jgi:poly(3-hydroxybutyrate) depolymerase